MTNKIFTGLIVLVFVLLGIGIFRSQTAKAPVEEISLSDELEKIDVKTEPVQSAEKSTESATNQTNENKTMGLEIKTTKEGTGDRVVKKGDTISVHYTGKLTNGTKFDSSVDRGTPFTFTVGEGMVIQGWEQGFIGAKVGEKRTLTIPAELGYGARAVGSIPANSTLVFDVEVISIR